MTRTNGSKPSPQELLQTKVFVTVTEAAEILGVSNAHVYQLIKEGHVVNRRMGKRYVIPVQQFKELAAL